MARVQSFSKKQERRLPALTPTGGRAAAQPTPLYVVIDLSQGEYAGGNSFDGSLPVDVCTARNRAYLLTQKSPVVFRAAVYEPEKESPAPPLEGKAAAEGGEVAL
jgi:hypothetical protein